MALNAAKGKIKLKEEKKKKRKNTSLRIGCMFLSRSVFSTWINSFNFSLWWSSCCSKYSLCSCIGLKQRTLLVYLQLFCRD